MDDKVVQETKFEKKGIFDSVWELKLPLSKDKQDGRWIKSIKKHLFPLAKNRIELFFDHYMLKAGMIAQTNTGFKIELSDSIAVELVKFVNISGASLQKVGLTRQQRRAGQDEL